MPEYEFVRERDAYIKHCPKCKTDYEGGNSRDKAERLLSKYFAQDRATRDGFYARCRKCVSKHQRGNRDGRVCDPEALLEAQNGKCGICEKEISFERELTKVTAYVDHNHETNKVRGILCVRCNSMLGTKDWIIKALNYLEKHDGKDN